ncbi:hypothetical protein ACIF80_17050 [Streptomyces sp. NPDC085927]|uniref:hypothetical protein n=1 Tax=Streptomyces sp. NPDC085927 TaxID=3365738 RepID=UPI0037CE7F33
MRPKRYLALLGVPLGASFMLVPGGSAQAAEASPSVVPSAVCSAIADAPPNPFGGIRGSGFSPNEQVRISADGQTIRNPTANAAGIVGVSNISLTARSYTLVGRDSGITATCVGLAVTTPTPTDPATGTTAVRDEGRRDGLADGLAGCRLGRVVTDAQEDEEGPRNADYFAGYTAGKAEALNRTACLNKPPQTTQPGQTDRDQQNGQNDRDRQGRGERDRGGNR